MERLSNILEEESKKYGWGLILVARNEFINFIKLLKTKRHLDIGCHKMLLKNLIKSIDNSIEYVGLDIWHYGTKIHVMASGDLLPFRENSFDTASLIETLEHIPDYPACLKQLYKIVRKGIFIQSVHCYSNASLLDRTHYHVLHVTTLTRLLFYIGFKKVQYGIKGGNLWVIAIK